MNKSPAFQFYPKDFLMDDKVAVMNLEQIGAYMKLLCYCWNNNGLPGDEEELREMCGNPQNWDKIWKKVGKCFYENKGKLHNKRLDKEKEKQEHWKEKSKEGGIKSGEARRKKADELKGGSNKMKGGSQMVEPNMNSSSPSSSPPSSPIAIPSSKKNGFAIKKEFDEFWKFYLSIGNKKDDVGDKQEAKRAYKILRRTVEKTIIAKSSHGYDDFLKSKRIDDNFKQRKMYGSTFLRSKRWQRFIDFKYKPPL